MKSPIQLDKQYKTRDGREVRIHAIDGPNPSQPVVASVRNGTTWNLFTWRADGSSYFGLDHESDLVEIVPRWEGEIWVHPRYGVRDHGYWGQEESIKAHKLGWRKITVFEKEAK